MQKLLDILMGRKKKKPGKQDGSEYVKKPQREGEPGYSRPEMVKKAENSKWSKQTHAVLPKKETVKTESLQGKKTSAESNTWDNKSNAKIPETKSLSGMIEFSSKNTWPKKSYAVTIQKKLKEEKESKK